MSIRHRLELDRQLYTGERRWDKVDHVTNGDETQMAKQTPIYQLAVKRSLLPWMLM